MELSLGVGLSLVMKPKPAGQVAAKMYKMLAWAVRLGGFPAQQARLKLCVAQHLVESFQLLEKCLLLVDQIPGISSDVGFAPPEFARLGKLLNCSRGRTRLPFGAHVRIQGPWWRTQ